MTLRANFQKNYLMRYLVLSGVCLFLAAWFAYDGLIGYPRQMVYAQAFEELSDLEPIERQKAWRELTTERNWPERQPEKSAEEIQNDIGGQYFWATLNLIVGFPALVLYIRSRGAWVESIPGGVKNSRGQEVLFSQVSQLNKKKWADKGIAKATYGDGAGTKTFVFDDFKFEREPLGKMLRELEATLKPEQIVGGPPESDSGSDSAAESLADSSSEGESASEGANNTDAESEQDKV